MGPDMLCCALDRILSRVPHVCFPPSFSTRLDFFFMHSILCFARFDFFFLPCWHYLAFILVNKYNNGLHFFVSLVLFFYYLLFVLVCVS